MTIKDAEDETGITRVEQHRLQISGLRKEFPGGVTAVRGVDLSLAQGELLALLGPSGCGKTTTLRMIAGLENPTSGEIRLDGRVVADGTRSTSPERRGLGMVFQSYALWPHLSVFENVAFGLRRAKFDKVLVRERVEETLALVGMTGYGDRSATKLSGGQQQRVAVARALATRPRLLLFDEPLSNLDAVLRESMRFEIRSLQQSNEIAAVYVTHSQEEALTIADVVGVMKDGRLEQLASPEVLYRRPRTRFVAGFVGLANILEGTVELRGGHTGVALSNGAWSRCVTVVDDRPWTTGDSAAIAVRPESIRIANDESLAISDGDLSLEGVVESVSYSGNLIDYFVRTEVRAEALRVQTLPPVRAREGDRVTLRAPSADCVLLDD